MVTTLSDPTSSASWGIMYFSSVSVTMFLLLEELPNVVLKNTSLMKIDAANASPPLIARSIDFSLPVAVKWPLHRTTPSQLNETLSECKGNGN